MMYTNASEVVSNDTEDNLYDSNSADNAISAASRYESYKHHAINADGFHFYGIGIVIPFGLIGNLFSICIFLLSPILRRSTTGQYLVALAIADTTVLVGEMLRWFTYRKQLRGVYYLPASLGLNICESSNAACRITYFLRYGGGLWSVWLTIAIAVERMLVVAFPLRISQISTLRRSRIVIFIITIISFSLALFAFWHLEIDIPPQCKIVTERVDDYKIWTTVIIRFGTLIIPGVLITVLTIIIIVLLYRARKKRMSQLAVNVQGSRKQWSNSGLSTETQLTIMLVTVCVATVALRAPYTIAYYFFSTSCWIANECNTLTKVQAYVAYRVTEVFNVINYSINFFLYCLSGSSFREQIKKTFCRGNKTGSNSDSQQISLKTSQTPQLGYNAHLLKVTPRASSSSQTNNI